MAANNSRFAIVNILLAVFLRRSAGSYFLRCLLLFSPPVCLSRRTGATTPCTIHTVLWVSKAPPPLVLSSAVSFLCLKDTFMPLFPHSLCSIVLTSTQNRTRQEVQIRLMDEAKEGGKETDVTNRACKPAWTLEWLVGDRCVINVNWHTLGCQTHTTLPDCLSVCLVLMTQGAGGQVCIVWICGQRGWLVAWCLCVCRDDKHPCIFCS